MVFVCCRGFVCSKMLMDDMDTLILRALQAAVQIFVDVAKYFSCRH